MLLGKEIRKTVLSLTFVAFIIALLVMTISQDVLNFSDEVIVFPKQGADYGIQQKEVPELIMPAAFSSLCEEFAANEYIAYPIGFYKSVKLLTEKKWQTSYLHFLEPNRKMVQSLLARTMKYPKREATSRLLYLTIFPMKNSERV